MAQETNIVAEPRTVHGSSAARRLRRSGFVPGVLATTDGKTELLQLNAHDFEREVARHSNPQFIAHISLGGTVRTALVRELQRDGITGRIAHADFGEVDPSKKLHVHIQLQLLGDPVGVRTENGVLEQQLRSVVVACLPKDAIETLAVDVSELHKNQDVKVRDLKLDPEKFTVSDDPDQVVCNVAEAVEEVPAAAAPAEGDAAQPELSVKKGKTDAAAAPAAAPAAKK